MTVRRIFGIRFRVRKTIPSVSVTAVSYAAKPMIWIADLQPHDRKHLFSSGVTKYCTGNICCRNTKIPPLAKGKCHRYGFAFGLV